MGTINNTEHIYTKGGMSHDGNRLFYCFQKAQIRSVNQWRSRLETNSITFNKKSPGANGRTEVKVRSYQVMHQCMFLSIVQALTACNSFCLNGRNIKQYKNIQYSLTFVELIKCVFLCTHSLLCGYNMDIWTTLLYSFWHIKNLDLFQPLLILWKLLY